MDLHPWRESDLNIRMKLITGRPPWNESESRPVVSNSLRPHGLHSSLILQARKLEWVAFTFSRGSSHPGIEPRSSAVQADSLPAELPGKPPWNEMHDNKLNCHHSWSVSEWQGTDFAARPPELLSWLCEETWASYLISLRLSFLEYKQGLKCWKADS